MTETAKDERDMNPPTGEQLEDRTPANRVHRDAIDLTCSLIKPLEHRAEPKSDLELRRRSEVQIESLLRDLRGTDPVVRREAAQALTPFGEAAGAAVPILIDQIRDPKDRRLPVTHLQALVLALGEVGIRNEAACATLARELGTPMVGGIARNGLLRSGEISIPYLIEALNDERLAAQLQAGMALRALGAPVVQPLSEMLNSSSSKTRCHAADILGGLGEVAEPALPALRRCAASWRLSVRFAARDAIDAIEAKLHR